jgi:hypothetical protein
VIKKSFIVLGAVVSVLLIAFYFSYDYWLEKELKYQLAEIINKDPNSLYEYHFEDLDIDLLNGSVDVTGISVEPRERAYDSLLADSSAVRFLLQLHLSEIELLEFEIREFINTGNITVRELRLDQPSFSYYFNPAKPKKQQKMPLSEIFSDQFKSANIKRLHILEGRLEIDNYLTEDPALVINYLDIELLDSYMDRQTLQNFSPVDYKEIKLVAGSISADISENFSIVSDSLYFDALDESFIIRDFEIQPKYNQQTWANMHQIQKQWFALKLGSVSLRKINLEHFVNSGEIKVGKIRVSEPNVALYKDKSKPEPPFKKKPLPASAINSIPIKINIDSLHIINGYVAIQETSKLTGLVSQISFYDLNGILTNFSNLPASERSSDIMELNASTLMYQKAPVNLSMKINLDSPTDQFFVTGQVGSVDMTAFNPVLEPMMAAKVLDGKLHELSFEFTAMDTLSTGTLDMAYSNAKIELLNPDNVEQENKKGFLSFAANTIIKTNNDPTKSGYTQGMILTKRALNKDVWPYLWHSVQSGIISTLVPIMGSKEVRQQQKEQRQQLKKERQSGKD